jgi:CubicO group peptidase (beta-lactamase class C family)
MVPNRVVVSFIVLTIAVFGIRAVGHTAVFPAATWRVCTPPVAQKGKIERFKSKVRGAGVLIKEGCQIASWGPYTGRVRWASASKPLLSMLLLRATQQGAIRSVDDPVNSVVQRRFGKPLASKDIGMTWAHLADMVSGYARGERPGEHWAYNDYGISLYRELLEEVYGSSLDRAFAPFKSTLRFQDGARFVASSGWEASPRDMARIGWLFANRGSWGGNQILSASFWNTYFKPQVHHNTPKSTKAGSDYLRVGTTGGGSNQTSMGPGYYGFNLWFNRGTSGGRFWPSAPDDAYQFNGHWGREVMTVIPGCHAVAAVKGEWGRMQPGISSGMNETMDLLKQAVCY